MRMIWVLFFVSIFGLTNWGLVRAADSNGLLGPSADAALQGVVEVTGVAQHPTFRKWQLDLLLNGDAQAATFVAVSETAQTMAGLLTKLDTTRYPNGNHALRLRVVHSNLNYDEYLTPILINNPNAPASAPNIESATAELIPQTLGPLGAGVPEGRRWIEVDISDQRLTAWQGDTPVLQTIISSGRAQYPTVRGTYNVRVKLPIERMIGPGYDTPNVPWTMYFFRGYAIHGAYWHNDFGTPVSHGCVNMRPDEAKLLYDWSAVGTEVVVHD